jgi:hypothetical protein
VAVTSYPSTTRSRRSLSGPSVRRHESLCYSCEASYHNGKRYTAGEKDSWGMGWTWLREGGHFGCIQSGCIGIGRVGVLGCMGRLGRMIYEFWNGPYCVRMHLFKDVFSHPNRPPK